MNTNRPLGYLLLGLSLLLIVGAAGQLPALLDALKGVGQVLTGQTDSYGSGHAIGALLHVLWRFGLPYLLWVQGQKALNLPPLA